MSCCGGCGGGNDKPVSDQEKDKEKDKVEEEEEVHF